VLIFSILLSLIACLRGSADFQEASEQEIERELKSGLFFIIFETYISVSVFNALLLQNWFNRGVQSDAYISNKDRSMS